MDAQLKRVQGVTNKVLVFGLFGILQYLYTLVHVDHLTIHTRQVWHGHQADIYENHVSGVFRGCTLTVVYRILVCYWRTHDSVFLKMT